MIEKLIGCDAAITFLTSMEERRKAEIAALETAARAICRHCCIGYARREDGWHETPSKAQEGYTQFQPCEAADVWALVEKRGLP